MLKAFRRHEEGHRALFGRYLVEHKVQRCRSYHLCGIGGLTLGIITGAFGRSAVAATTVAVERVVLRHLNDQLRQLASLDAGAYAAVAAIVLEETEHHDTANLDLQQGRFWPRLIMPVVSAATEAVIWLGLKL
jgi:ubiquinone biosynthesis monooxygenase Coq7